MENCKRQNKVCYENDLKENQRMERDLKNTSEKIDRKVECAKDAIKCKAQ